MTERDTLVEALRADLALAAESGHSTDCEGCGAAILQHEDACHYGDVAGCWPYVTGDKAPGPCWRYRTERGMDRGWPKCALAAELAADPTQRLDASGQRLEPARVQVRNPINGDHHVLDTDTARTVETRRDGPAPGVPVLEPKDGGRDDG